MVLQFPEHFFWGSSTSAAQIETAFNHQWKGTVAKDGYEFIRTIDHEQRREEDTRYISEFGSVYRCSVDWSRLQQAPYADFEEEVVDEYQAFFAGLQDEGMGILFVMHHFANPQWFEAAGGWLVEDNIPAFIDFAGRCMEHFGTYTVNWNTFNEPNGYAIAAFGIGEFPPYHRNPFQVSRVLKHMGMAHDILYKLLKSQDPEKPVGIAYNTSYFTGANLLGAPLAGIADWWYNHRMARPFEQVDYWGLTYYAYVPFNPLPVTEIKRPGQLDKMGIPHDKMWGYYPEGFGKMVRRFYKKYQKPIIITESGICTDDPQRRIESIKDYLKVFHEAIEEGVDIKGYIHWSTFDNFEWHLGPTYRFGLVRVDLDTKERSMTDAGRFYAQITKDNALTLDQEEKK